VIELASKARLTLAKSVAGGQTTTSLEGGLAMAFAARFSAKATPASRRPFIFQLPAINFLRSANFGSILKGM
jgi:hypothetical protein